MGTVLLVLQRKPVIFLHSYHHVTVLVFCWSAYVRDASAGIWYACMNYCVHSVMYAYYLGLFISLFRSKYKQKHFSKCSEILEKRVGDASGMFHGPIAEEQDGSPPVSTAREPEKR